jgi:hypothetical protein
MLTSKEHYELIDQFDREFADRRLDKEAKSFWLKGNIYQDGTVNELFSAYRRGYAFGKAVQA